MPYAQSAGTPIWWEEQGTGEPLLLIMGLGFPASLWYRVRPALAERHRVISFDNRGTGATGPVPGPYPIEAMAADAAAVLDAAGVDRAHVLGISMGGLIAQELTLANPERVTSLILAATHPGGEATVLPEPEVLQLLQTRTDLPLEESYRVTIPVAYAAKTAADVIDADIAARLGNPTSAEGYTNQLLGGMAYSGAADRLPTVGVPTLCLHGSDDRLVPPVNSETLASLVPGARVHIIDGAAHMLFSDAPEAFVDAVVGFTWSLAASAGT
jgi:pimeloyl-ACP methyl ester carboxylesterase